ncbi:breast cancer type 2 susceptibility protein isoform X2 [Dendropsophus ebraccatus]|uniref:breast cancer type 2 susceptibility protein isoform X2 n=1 Tax=Dendropsophus ebraccatus TaxID=150705 RepID=UPI003831F191
MASVQPATSVFFRLFQAHCSHSDLGPINVNWFEELTREAVRLQPRLHEEDEKRRSQRGDSLFKTPQQKHPHYSQLESTPTIFKEQTLCSPLFLTPTKEQDKSQLTEEKLRNVKTQKSPDTSAPANEAFGTSSRYLPDSPAVMEPLFKAPFGDRKYLQGTPQQDRKFDISDSLLCTPQFMRNQSSMCISESLGAEVDSEMSWTSSLATPPSPTFIIDQAKDVVSEPRGFGKEDVVIVRSLFSNKNGVAQAVSLAPPTGQKIDSDSSKFGSLDLKNTSPSHDPPEVKQVENEDEDDFKDNSLDYQEIEETFMNVRQMRPTDPKETFEIGAAVPSVGGDSIKTEVAESERISQLEDGALQLSEVMLAHSSTKVRVLDSVVGVQNREHNSQGNPCIFKNNCDFICTTLPPESKSIKTCIDLPVDTNKKSFKGFETASSKKIHISEENLRKGELLLQEDKALTFSCPTKIENGDKSPLMSMTKAEDTMIQKDLQTASSKEIPVPESRSILCKDHNPIKRHKTNNYSQSASNVEREEDEMAMGAERVASGHMDGVSFEENKPCKQSSSDSQSRGDISIQSWKENSARASIDPSKVSNRSVQSLSNGRKSQLYNIFTESQKAEICELSSILENASSQLDFTPFKKLNIPGIDNVQNPISDSQKLNTSDVWKDVDFNDSFAAGEGHTESNVFSVTSEFDTGSNACDVADNKFVPDSLVKHRDGGGTMASANITDEDLMKAIEMFGDLEEKAKEKSVETMQHLNSKTSSDLHVIVEGRASTPPVNNALNIQNTVVSSTKTKEKYFPDKQEHCKRVQNYDKASDSCGSHTSAVSFGFATGKGKLIDINKASLDKVNAMFNKILDIPDPCKDYRRTGTVHEPAELLTETKAHQVSTTIVGKETRRPTSDHPSVVLSKEIEESKVISLGSFQRPKQITQVSSKEVTEQSCLLQNNPVSTMSLFSTASGKPVLLSEESLKRVQKMFSEVDGGHVGEQETTAVISADSAVNARSTHDLQNKSIQGKESTFNLNSPGFSTANGKMTGNSKRLLQKSEELFADIGGPNGLDIGQRTLSTHSKPKVDDQRKDKVYDVADFLDQRLKASETQIGKVNPLLKNTADLGSDVLAEIPPFNDISNRELSNKNGLCKEDVPNVGMPSFSSAGGKSITMFNDSLKKAQGIFHDIDDRLLSDQEKLGSSVNQNERQNPKSTFPPPGFSTASGKVVAVSESSLQKVRQILADADHAVLEAGPNKTLTKSVDTLEPNLRAVSGAAGIKNLKPSLNQCTNSTLGKIMDKSMCCPQQETDNRKMAFFSKASGSHFNLSSKALQKAREIFADISEEPMEGPLLKAGASMKENERVTDLFSVTSGNLNNIQRPTMQANDSIVTLPPVGFNTASEKPMTGSRDSLQKTKPFFIETDNALDPANTAIKSEQGGFSAAGPCQTNKRWSSVPGKTGKFYSSEGNWSRHESGEPLVEDGFIPRMPCFSTAGGKSVTVLEESLKRTRKIFSEVDDGCSSQRDDPVDIQPNPKSMPAPKASLGEKSLTPNPSGMEENFKMPAKTSFGFSTGSGKHVTVSEDALQKVKGFFEECNSNVKDIKENQDSVRMSIRSPLLNKPHLQDPVTKLGHVQKNSADGNGGKQNTSARPSDFTLPRLVRHSTPRSGTGTTNVYLTSSHTPENDFETEAAESAKAFMDDEDLTDADIRTHTVFPSSDKHPNIRSGKRLRSNDVPSGEPPIKRQLLPEFDRSLENESKAALKPVTSSPHESLMDRRRYLHNVSLQPLSSHPSNFLKRNSMDARSTPLSHLHCNSQTTLPASSTRIPADCRHDTSNTPRTATSSFVIPFKKKLHMSSDDQMANMPSQDQDKAKDLIRESGAEIGMSEKDESDLSDLVANICCAREMQEMRIRKKQRQKIKPQPGLLYLQKTSSTDRINLVTGVEGRKPTVYTQTELYRWGVMKNHIGINSEKARTFEFRCLDYFPRECFLSDGGVHIADGGWLVPTVKVIVGREEFYRALCDTPGVDPKLISPEWVHNHYRWIVWKLAAMEVMFPMIFASRCLTPERVLLQLKYRYDVEINKCQRSAVRKIMERDDTSAKTLVLCISNILTLGNSETNEMKQTSAVIEVTDGWYGIKALLDPALTSLLKKGRLFIGQKIIVHGAELVGSEDACTPLEAPESLMLKIAGNSTRPARWFARLGYFHDPRPFCLRLSSLLADGGVVGCIDVLIQRIYPMQWMEKMGNGTYVFRNERAEEREAEKHSAKKQKSLEVLYVKIQAEYEKQQVCDVKIRPRRLSLSEAQIRALQDGAELYEALQNEPDPSYLESCLSNDQLRALNHYRQTLNDKRHAQIQAEFRKAIESSEQEAGSTTRRDVTPVWKIRIVDYKDPDSSSAYILNIWRPLPDVVSLLKEGGRFRIYQLAASQSKGKSDMAAVQLTATKKTQFQQLQPIQDVLKQIYTERQVTGFSQFQELHFTAAYGEVDVVGLVISTQLKPGAAPMVYLSDETYHIVALKFYTDIGQLALEELIRPGTYIAAANLRWRSEYTSGVPVLFAGDLCFIAANPKEHHLLKAIQKCRQSIQSVPEFCKEMENKLMNILETQNPLERVSLARCGVDPHSHVAAGSRCSTPLSKINPPQMKHMSTPDSNNTVFSTSNEMDPKTCKIMRGLDYLCRIPSPAPLNAVQALPSPSLQRAFRPPRSVHKEHGISAKSKLNNSCTPSKLEGGFVADEELAMINTQALILGMDGGSKVTTGQEGAASDIQKKTTSDISEGAQNTQEVSETPYQRQLSRKRKKP